MLAWFFCEMSCYFANGHYSRWVCCRIGPSSKIFLYFDFGRWVRCLDPMNFLAYGNLNSLRQFVGRWRRFSADLMTLPESRFSYLDSSREPSPWNYWCLSWYLSFRVAYLLSPMCPLPFPLSRCWPDHPLLSHRGTNQCYYSHPQLAVSSSKYWIWSIALSFFSEICSWQTFEYCSCHD